MTLVQWRLYQNLCCKKYGGIFVNITNINDDFLKIVFENALRHQFLQEMMLKEIVQHQFSKTVFKGDEFSLFILVPSHCLSRTFSWSSIAFSFTLLELCLMLFFCPPLLSKLYSMLLRSNTRSSFTLCEGKNTLQSNKSDLPSLEPCLWEPVSQSSMILSSYSMKLRHWRCLWSFFIATISEPSSPFMTKVRTSHPKLIWTHANFIS